MLFTGDLPQIEPINNLEICEPFDEYLRDETQQNYQENLVLKRGFMLDQDGVLMPTELFDKLAETYGCDVKL